MKQKVLFTIDSLHCAGAEKSLTTLLSLIDYTKFDVDLQLLGYGGALEKILPKAVNLLPPLEYTQFANLSIKQAIIQSLSKLQINEIRARVKYSRKIRKENLSNAQKARVFWEAAGNTIEENRKHYDVAIAYAQGVPTFYVADKINATNKYAWVNVSYRLNEEDRKFQEKFYDQYDKIVAVSESTQTILLETFPNYGDKVEVIYDINDAKLISEMAELEEGFNDNFDGIRILTVGRLANQKGYDIALRACERLKEQGVKFRWYALGKGPLQDEIETYIIEHKLEDYFKLLGVKANPYPYFKACDIYVQTSRFEGFGIAIAEARMLNKPVVTTRFDAVYSQMIEGQNGLVVDMNDESVYKGIIQLINNQQLYEHIVAYLKQEKKGNAEELQKFYKLIG
ncbi:glycosyltransferase [Niameybacter massiliensis]|uniref:glycosyltransferase n=1 Tax=Niameybacter massiliensis TaxID=1658108 RepID=UPI0006B4C2D8|nr:glycosyltransferase [Niameybacter massiliensis]